MAPKQGKRKSSGGDSAKAARKAKEARVTCPATEAITSWLESHVISVGGVDVYMEKTFPTEAAQMEFAAFIDVLLPPEPARIYAADFRHGTCFLRPFMVGWRKDFGLSGMSDPDTFLALVELILSEGFRSDPSMIGTEMLSIISPLGSSSMLDGPYKQLDPLHPDRVELPPFSVAFVKGWRRCSALMGILCAIKALGLEKDSIPASFLASARTLHASCGSYENMRQQVWAHRGVQMASSATRKPPHAFNFLRECDVLARSGFGKTAEEQFADWSNATAVSRAFSLGKAEAAAVSALQSGIDKAIVSELKLAVAKRGLRSFMSHDVLGKGFFSLGISSACGSSESWVSEMTNTDDQQTVKLLLERHCCEWDSLSVKQPLTAKNATPMHQCCAVFLHMLKRLQTVLPSADYPGAVATLRSTFLLGGLDNEILTMVTTHVPPANLKAVGAFRNQLDAAENKQAAAHEEKAQALAQKVAQATLAQLVGQLEGDILKLRSALPNRASQAMETALDVKYVKDRQMQGHAYVAEWMEKNCKTSFHVVKPDGADSSTLNTALSDFTRYTADRFAASGKTVYVLASVDATIWPSSTQYMMECLSVLLNVISLGPCNVGHVQKPLEHQATNFRPLLKNVRRVEDALVGTDSIVAKCDITQRLTLIFAKDSARQGSDKRPMTQDCISPFASKACKWQDSEAHQTGYIGPMNLIRVSEMVGYDAENHLRPSAAARIEQKGVECHKTIVQAYLQGMPFDSAKDAVVFFDIYPNQQAEFAQAIVDMNLHGAPAERPELIYVGLFREDEKKSHKKVLAEIESKVYTYWDGLASSPPQTRTRSVQSMAVQGLEVISCTDSGPVWPDTLDSKFPSGTPEHKALGELKAKFLEEFPTARQGNVASSSTPSTVPTAPRVSGQPDFTLDGGREPLDLTRELDLEVQACPEPADRLGMIPSKGGKPAVLIDRSYGIWLGNEKEEEFLAEAQELCGFNTGCYDHKIVRGSHDSSGVVWRLQSDLEYIIFEKKAVAISQFMHTCASARGLAEINILEHVVTPKVAAAAEEEEALPVPFRYNINPLESLRTQVFKPNPITGDPKSNNLGAVFLSKMDFLPRNSKAVQVLWEVGLQGNKMIPQKPKLFLTASVRLAPNSWVKLP